MSNIETTEMALQGEVDGHIIAADGDARRLR